MSAHPALRELGDRVQKLGKLELGHTLAHLGADLCTEFPALRVFRELVGWIGSLADENAKLKRRVEELEGKR